MERGMESIMSVSRAAMGHGKRQALSALQPGPPFHILIDFGDMVEEREGDNDVVPEVEDTPDGSFCWQERQACFELVFIDFIHGGSPSPPILFMYRGARPCHRSPTNCGIGWSFCGPALSELGSYHRKHAVFRVRD